MIDGDVFKIIVPLDNEYSFYGVHNKALDKAQDKARFIAQLKHSGYSLTEQLVLDYFVKQPNATQADAAKAVGKSRTSVQDAITKLKEKGLLEREGAKKTDVGSSLAKMTVSNRLLHSIITNKKLDSEF